MVADNPIQRRVSRIDGERALAHLLVQLRLVHQQCRRGAVRQQVLVARVDLKRAVEHLRRRSEAAIVGAARCRVSISAGTLRGLRLRARLR